MFLSFIWFLTIFLAMLVLWLLAEWWRCYFAQQNQLYALRRQQLRQKAIGFCNCCCLNRSHNP